MKKVLTIVLLMFISIMRINATEIKKIYMDAEVEIAGGLRVREVVYVKDQDSDVKLNVFYKDNSLKKFNNDRDSLYGSKIYNADGVKIAKVGIVKSGVDLETYTDNDFYEKNVTNTKYTTDDDKEYTTIKLPKKSGDNVYYIEYTVLNILVEHKDCAELYYKFIDKFDYDVEEVVIITKLPYNSKLFKVWAHGTKNASVTNDLNSSMVYNKIKNFEKGSYLDNRILFDRDMFMLNINEYKKSNMDAVKLITSIEEERIDNTENFDIIKIVLIASVLLLVILIVAYFIYVNRIKKRKK